MTEINWNAFKVKFNGKERATFEQLAYLLFCHEYNRPFGIFRFKNQTGIETEPIQVNEQSIGFQSKYLDISIPAGKDDIIDSIQKAKSKNSDLSKILLYVNHEFTESSKSDTKDPQYKVDIESAATKLGVNVEWRVPSHIERQLAEPANHHLLHHFFSLGKGPVEFLEEIMYHTESILKPIRSEIQFSSNQIKIDHKASLNVLRTQDLEIILVFGEGGSGKTGLIKDLYLDVNNKLPFYVFKATEFRLSSTNEFFSRFGHFSLQDFIKFHESQRQKFIVIDSAEKLSDLENIDVFKELLASFIEAKWTVIFTTRLSYLENLRFQLVEIYRAHFNEISIPNFSEKELLDIAIKNNFQLPTNERLLKLVHNPFYLNEYLQHYQSIGNAIDLKSFKRILWKAKVQQSVHKDNLHIQREETFMKLVKAKCDNGSFFLKTETAQNHVLSKLSEDEIIKYEESGGYFIAHDIYEEWALDRIIEREFRNTSDYKAFLENIGTSLSIRRSFRNWLSEYLMDDVTAIRHFIEHATVHDDIDSFWKDEILISVLLSDYVQIFFDLFNSKLLLNEKFFLNRVIFLLRTACKEIDSNYYSLLPQRNEYGYLVTRPKGPGWDRTINFLFEHSDKFTHTEVQSYVSFVSEWVSSNLKGATTRNAALFILNAYQEAEIEKEGRFHTEEREEMESIILQGAIEIKPELDAIFNQVIENKWWRSSDPYSNLCKAALSRTYINVALISALPESLIAIAYRFWFKENEPKPKSQFGFEFDDDSMEHHYSIRSNTERGQASAYQSPILWLLRRSPQVTIDFILDFVNKTVESYAKSPMASRLDKVQVIDVFVGDGVSHKQYISQSIWSMYRGTGSPVVPSLLQSIHMALEKYLLEAAKRNPKSVGPWLIYLLKNTKSASITSVVTSVVLAFPNEFFEYAVILFNTYELYFYDNMRLANESGAERLYSIGYGLIPDDKKFQDERIASCKDPHRQNCLERQIVLYQKFRKQETSEDEMTRIQSTIWQILDKFYASLPVESKQTDADLTKRLLLTRIDGRKLKYKVEEVDGNMLISFETDVEPELKKHSEEATRGSQRFIKYAPLHLWGTSKFEKSEKANQYPQYEDKPMQVLKDTRELIEDMNTNGVPRYSFDSTAPAFACAALLKNYSLSLSLEDIQFCRGIVLGFSSKPLQPEYDYQISDGVEAAVSALPTLMTLCPDERGTIKEILLMMMFDRHPIGEYKRVCDYAIESIVNGFGKDSPEEVKSLFYGVLLLAPKLNKHMDQSIPKGQRFHDRNTRIESLRTFCETHRQEIDRISSNSIAYQTPESVSIQDALIAFQLIPTETTDINYLEFIKWIIPRVSEVLLDNKDKTDYKAKIIFLKQFALFILRRDTNEIEPLITPWLSRLPRSDSFKQFVEEFVSVEDRFFSYEQFWVVWNLLYPTICNYCKSEDYRVREVVPPYLLAWRWWREDAKTWRSLKDREKVFFKRASADIGSHPIVLYSISKFLNEIGSDFSMDGLTWISDVIRANSELSNSELERNTTYYLDLFVRKFSYVNRTRIKTDLIVRKKVITILNFLVAKGSVQAYLLREEII